MKSHFESQRWLPTCRGYAALGLVAWLFTIESTSVAATLNLPTRSRVETAPGSGQWQVVERTVSWDPLKSAIVVCDMWDRHWCAGATRRVAEMAPRMNAVIKSARAQGVLIIHCPSDTMKYYEATPQRQLARNAPNAPGRPEGWRSLDRSREPALPIDDSDGGCDDWPRCKEGSPWTREISTLEVASNDAVTDSEEAYNLMKSRGITNVLVMGVHLNMCVLGRPFSVRQMVLHGQNVLFMRDMTDTMYNSRMPPFVSHFAGTDLVAEHIEKYWCPSITSAAFLGGEPFRFHEDRRPHIVFLIGEDEYHTWETLPEFAQRDLAWRGFEIHVIGQDPANKHNFPGLVEALHDADALIVSVRRRALPQEQLNAVRDYLAAGKPLVGLRTACHAFAPRGDDAGKGAAWESFDPDVLGGNYQGHYDSGPRVEIIPATKAGHPILNSVQLEGLFSNGSLYRVSPLKPDAEPILLGRIPNHPEEPVAWVRTFGPRHARVFYTSLGHPDDFKVPAFRQLLLNGILWALDRPIPPVQSARADVEKPNRDPWQTQAVPGTGEDPRREKLGGYDGFAWYRCLVRPPADWAERDWELWVENIGNVHEAFVDGVRVGGAGQWPPNYASGLEAKNHYPIPSKLRRPGQWQLVAIRVYDHDGRGGFKGRAPGIRSGNRVIALAGEWQFRWGDQAAWAVLADGETLDHQLFHEVISLEQYERGGVPEKIIPQAKPLSPLESSRRFTVADGLEMELVLSEPDIAQPLQISFDERGRMWLVEYRQYPAPAGLKLVSHDQFWRAVYDKVPQPPPNHIRGKDRISIHEDTDGDGIYDKHTVFVDGLNIATSAVKGRGGVWVLNPPYLLFYPDRNEDDVPDGDPEARLEGFGLEDTHSVANSLRWGPDGWLYAAQGSTVTGRIRQPGTTNAPIQTLGQNVWRYQPESRRYEVFAEGGGNAFGVEIDDRGRIFSGHNGGNTRGFHYVQGAFLQKGFDKHGQLSNPYAFGYFPAMAHHDVERFTHTFLIYGGGAFSAQFDGHLFGVEPLQGRVVMSEMMREGSTFRTRDIAMAVTTTDPWFKPVDIKLGPDGALYVADWYDFQVNHWRNYQGNMDASNGRVYRLKARGAVTATLEDLGKVSSLRLVEQLSNPNRWVRQTSLRLLADRGDLSILPILEERLRSAEGQAALEALWAIHSIGGLHPELARRALKHSNPAVREWTIRLLGDSNRLPPQLAGPVEELAASEPNIDVRIQLAASARRLPSSQAMPVIRRLLSRDEDTSDPRQPLMLWWAIEAHAGSDRPAVLELLADPALWTHPLVADHLLERLMRRYAMESSAEDLAACAELLRRAPSSTSRARLVTGFEMAFQDRSLAGLPSTLIEALASAGGGSLALQTRMGREGALPLALKRVEDELADGSERVQVIQTLGDIKDARSVPSLLKASASSHEPIRVAALAALRQFDQPEIGSQVIRLLNSETSPTRTAALILLASRPTWSKLLVQAVARSEVQADSVNLDLARQLKRHKDPELAAEVARLWPQTGRPTTAAMDKEITRLAHILGQGSGDPYNGKRLFTATCASCHKLFNAGGSIGPDLTPFRRDQVENLLLNIVNPSAEIREGYENYSVDTKDDRSLTGFVVRQDDRAVVLRGLDGQDVLLMRSEISELRPAGMSMMPEGLLEGLEDQQVRDLFAYLRSSQPLAN